MSTAGLIYVAGNPDLYPLEYYDAESGTYQGVIPAFLEQFAQEAGYELQYFQPGEEDRRGNWRRTGRSISSPAAWMGKSRGSRSRFSAPRQTGRKPNTALS